MGSIFLILGGIISTIGIGSMASAKQVNDLEKDMDFSTNTFKSYDKGDKFILNGKIVAFIETKYILGDDNKVSEEELIENFGGKYIFILDKKIEVYSNEKIGNIGDTIFIECEIGEIKKSGRMEEILKANPSYNIIMITSVGIIFLLISFINIFLVFKKKKAIEKASSKPYKIAKMYEDIDNEDEEAFLYKFLKTSDDVAKSTLNQAEDEKINIQTNTAQTTETLTQQPGINNYPTVTISQPTIQAPQSPIPQMSIDSSSFSNIETSSSISSAIEIPVTTETSVPTLCNPIDEKIEITQKPNEDPMTISPMVTKTKYIIPQALPVQSCFRKIKQKQIRTPITTQPTIASQPTITSQPTIASQPTIVSQPTITHQPTIASQPTITPQPTIASQPTITPQPTIASRPTIASQSTIASRPTIASQSTIASQPTIASQSTIASQPTITQNIQSAPKEVESSTERLKIYAEKLKIRTEKMQVPIAKPAAKPIINNSNDPPYAKLIRIKIPQATVVQSKSDTIPPEKEPIMAKPILNQEKEKHNELIDYYKGIESEDDEITLYKSLHSIKKENEKNN